MKMIARDDELLLIKRYSTLLNEYFEHLSTENRTSFIDNVKPILKERGMDNMEELIKYLSSERYTKEQNNRALLQLRMDLAVIFSRCFDQLRTGKG